MVDQVPAEIRVLLADDHTLVRSGIARIVAEEPGMEVVGEVGDGSARAPLSSVPKMAPGDHGDRKALYCFEHPTDRWGGMVSNQDHAV